MEYDPHIIFIVIMGSIFTVIHIAEKLQTCKCELYMWFNDDKSYFIWKSCKNYPKEVTLATVTNPPNYYTIKLQLINGLMTADITDWYKRHKFNDIYLKDVKCCFNKFLKH